MREHQLVNMETRITWCIGEEKGRKQGLKEKKSCAVQCCHDNGHSFVMAHVTVRKDGGDDVDDARQSREGLQENMAVCLTVNFHAICHRTGSTWNPCDERHVRMYLSPQMWSNGRRPRRKYHCFKLCRCQKVEVVTASPKEYISQGNISPPRDAQTEGAIRTNPRQRFVWACISEASNVRCCTEDPRYAA
jgi:hypothetical protein